MNKTAAITVTYDVGGINLIKDNEIIKIANQFHASFIGSGCFAQGERDLEFAVEADKAEAMVAALKATEQFNVSIDGGDEL